jgi:hypothetical protein
MLNSIYNLTSSAFAHACNRALGRAGPSGSDCRSGVTPVIVTVGCRVGHACYNEDTQYFIEVRYECRAR